MKIDINSDIGESFGNYKMHNDAEIIKHITSANIACGFHAGDPLVMEKTVKLALEHNVCIGAHPGYPDLLGFGRRSIKISDDELHAMILYQVGALKTITEVLGGKLSHVKLHGAMYNDYANDYKKAKIVAKALYKISPDLIFVGLAQSQCLQAARDAGLKTANEVFADRPYNDDGSLVSRIYQGAVIQDLDVCLKQIKQMIIDKSVQSINGNRIEIYADSICVHGDNDCALEFLKGLNDFLTENNIEVVNLQRLSI